MSLCYSCICVFVVMIAKGPEEKTIKITIIILKTGMKHVKKLKLYKIKKCQKALKLREGSKQTSCHIFKNRCFIKTNKLYLIINK